MQICYKSTTSTVHATFWEHNCRRGLLILLRVFLIRKFDPWEVDTICYAKYFFLNMTYRHVKLTCGRYVCYRLLLCYVDRLSLCLLADWLHAVFSSCLFVMLAAFRYVMLTACSLCNDDSLSFCNVDSLLLCYVDSLS